MSKIKAIKKFLDSKPALTVSGLEREADIPTGILNKALSGSIELPAKHLPKLLATIKPYGYNSSYEEKSYLGKSFSFWVVKGGAGKTFLTKNTGYALAKEGYKVLLIDNDFQSNLTNQLPELKGEAEMTVLDLYGEPGSADWKPLKVEENLYVIPGDKRLSRQRPEISSRAGSQILIKRAIEAYKDDYDFILIDPRPDDYDILSMNTIAASDYIFIPINPDLGSVEGLNDAIKFVNEIRNGFGFNIQIGGALINEYVTGAQASELTLELLNEEFPDYMLKSFIRRDEVQKKSTFTRASIFELDKESRVSSDIRNLAAEILTIVK